MRFKKILVSISAFALFFLASSPALAHSVVSPKQVGVGAFQDFTVSVPSEKNANTTSVRLVLPSGLNFVTPVVKPGWKIEVKSENAVPSEIIWSGGSVPTGQKELFLFSAQVPAQPTDLDWKIYQTYDNNSEVAWELGPTDEQPKDINGKSSFDSKGPYSKTMVINDLAPSPSPSTSDSSESTPKTLPAPSSDKTLGLALLGIFLGGLALALHFKK